MMETLSPAQARKLALLSQGLPVSGHKGLSGTLASIQQLSYVQIDSISVVSRAHHHTLWSRVKGYRPEHLDTLLKQGKIFEYWSHAAAYLPMEDFRFTLLNKARIAHSEHWFKPNPKVEQEVLARIRQEGPLQAKDFDKPDQHKGSWWQWKPAKKALEQLFMAGELMCPYRAGFQKVYDLTERVLPADVDTRTPSDDEMARYLIERSLNSHGFTRLDEAGYLRKGIKASIKEQLHSMQEQGELSAIQIGSQAYVTTPALLERLNRPLARKKISLLSPFDNLVIQRKRLQHVFDFDYKIECYVPANKRQFGYYALPILWQGELIARVDAKADRKTGIFHINKLVLEEPAHFSLADFSAALFPVLQDYAKFNQCLDIVIHTTEPSALKELLQQY